MLRVQCLIDSSENYIRSHLQDDNPILQIGDWHLNLTLPVNDGFHSLDIKRRLLSQLPSIYFIYSPIEMWTIDVLEVEERQSDDTLVQQSPIIPYKQTFLVTIHFGNGAVYRMEYYCDLNSSEVKEFTNEIQDCILIEAEEHQGHRIQDFGELHGDWTYMLFKENNKRTL